MHATMRNSLLTAHVVVSLGWLGAVAAFFALSVAAIASAEVELVCGCYGSMNLIGLYVIVPLSLLSAATGATLALAGGWGLLRHYWVLVKLGLTALTTILLLLHQVTAVAGAAQAAHASAATTMPAVGRLGAQLVVDSGSALLVLVLITAVSVFKPWGPTPYGRRREADERGHASAGSADEAEARTPTSLIALAVGFGAVAVGIVASHVAGGGMGHHRH